MVTAQLCNIFQRSAFHSQTARKCMSQVVPTKLLDLRFGHRVVEPVPPIFARFHGLRRLEHTPSAFAPAMHNPQGGNRSIIWRDAYWLFVLRPRNVQRPTSKVYHVPRKAVLTALPRKANMSYLQAFCDSKPVFIARSHSGRCKGHLASMVSDWANGNRHDGCGDDPGMR